MKNTPKTTLTSLDYENLKKIFATKEDLNELRGELKALEEKMTMGFAWVIEEFAKIRREMVTKADITELMGEIKAMREEHAISIKLFTRNNDRVENHEDRIVTLEDKILVQT